MASYTLGEADILRKAMSKKIMSLLAHEEDKFIKNSVKNGYDKTLAKKVFDYILEFANYGFNKSHSVSYSLVAYKMAYLKHYYPKYFYSNLLKSVVGSQIKSQEYLNEIKKLSIKILPPDVNKSNKKEYLVVNDGILAPLSMIRQVGEVIATNIIEERNNKSFIDIYDFFKRMIKKSINKKIFESLAYSHALNSFGYNIKTIIENLEAILNYAELTIDLDENFVPKPEIIIYEEYDIDEILEKEKELFGFYLTSHKTEKYKLNEGNITDLNIISDYFNKNITIVVNIDKIKEITTKKNEIMAFITGSDNTGVVSITVFPNLYREIEDLDLKRGQIIKVLGRVEKRFDEYQVVGAKIIKL